MDFAADSELCKEVAEKCRSTATSVSETIKGIYVKIDEMGGDDPVWAGASYDAFKEKCHSYEDALQGLVDVLNAYGKLMDNAGLDTENLVEKVGSALE